MDETDLICRCCLDVPRILHPFDAELPECGLQLSKVLAMFIPPSDVEDTLPQYLCPKCVNDLSLCYKFVDMYKKSEEVLMQKIVTKEQPTENSEPFMHFVVEKTECEIDSPEDVQPNDTYVQETIMVPLKEETEDSESDYENVDLDNLIAQSVHLTNSLKDTEEYGSEDANEDTYADNIVAIDHSKLNKGPIQCPSCAKQFQSVVQLGRHLNLHKVSVLCSACNVLFSDGQEYSIHYTAYHLYQCNVCLKNLGQAKFYKKHMLSHAKVSCVTGERSFRCPVDSCGKTYQTKYTLHYHMRTIHGNENYLCNQCGQTFKNADVFRYHLKKHKGPSHACPYCPKKYMQAVHLRCHMWRHTGVKPHKCEKCHLAFAAPHALRKHRRANICRPVVVKNETN